MRVSIQDGMSYIIIIVCLNILCLQINKLLIFLIYFAKQGDRIHAQIKRRDVDNFSRIMKEGRIYAMKNFKVLFNKMRMKTTDSKHKLIFLIHYTVVCGLR